MKKIFILYDERAKHGVDTDDCSVLETADSEEEARSCSGDSEGFGGVWFEYDLVNDEAMNEKRRDDLGGGK